MRLTTWLVDRLWIVANCIFQQNLEKSESLQATKLDYILCWYKFIYIYIYIIHAQNFDIHVYLCQWMYIYIDTFVYTFLGNSLVCFWYHTCMYMYVYIYMHTLKEADCIDGFAWTSAKSTDPKHIWFFLLPSLTERDLPSMYLVAF